MMTLGSSTFYSRKRNNTGFRVPGGFGGTHGVSGTRDRRLSRRQLTKQQLLQAFGGDPFCVDCLVWTVHGLDWDCSRVRICLGLCGSSLTMQRPCFRQSHGVGWWVLT